MDHLWTPWRFHYISSTEQQKDCVFCSILKEGADRDRDNLILLRSSRCFAILNRFPYTSGHLLIVLYRHVAGLSDAVPEELEEMIRLSAECEKALREVYRPDGFNMGRRLEFSFGFKPDTDHSGDSGNHLRKTPSVAVKTVKSFETALPRMMPGKIPRFRVTKLLKVNRFVSDYVRFFK